MRRIVVFDRVSADGYFAAADGQLDWVVPDEALDRAIGSRIDQAGPRSDGGNMILFGRRTYEMFASFWPHVLDDSPTAPDPHNAMQRSAAMRAMAVWLNDATKVVFSSTLTSATWKNTRLHRALTPEIIESLRAGDGSDILVFGSGSIVSQLASWDLIDEYQFVVGPVLLGDGTSLLSGVSARQRLDLLESTAYPSGNLMLRYGRRR